MPALLTFFFFFQILPVQVFFSPYDHSRNLSMHSSISKKSGKDENIYDVLYCLTTNKNWTSDKEMLGGTKQSN